MSEKGAVCLKVEDRAEKRERKESRWKSGKKGHGLLMKMKGLMT